MSVRPLIWGSILVLLLAGPARADEVELFAGQRFQGGPWRIKAAKLVYEAERHTYIAEGDVEMRQGDRRLSAERVEVNEQTKIAWVSGNVILVLEEDILTGREGSFNLATRDGEMEGARLFLRRNRFHVDSSLIRKTGENSYYAEQATVTTCDPDRPVWSFSVRRLNVVTEGLATSRDNVLRLAGVPVLYAPYGVLPVVKERQSGFLTPVMAYHRNGGTVAEVPFYWAISNTADATFYQTYLSERGYMQGVQTRYRGYRGATWDLRFQYIDDHDQGVPTRNRYWVAGMVDQPLPGDWQMRLTLDRTSDFNFLKDFNFGYQGLNRVSRDFLGDFGRSLEQQEVQSRVSSFLLSRNFAYANFTSYARYYERLLTTDPPLFHRLPGLSLNTLALPVGDWPFRVSLGSSYTHFYQPNAQTGQKLDLHPTLMCQVQPLSGVSLDSRVGFRETFFRLDNHTSEGVPGDNLFRTLYDVKVSLSSLLFRDYRREEGRPQFYRHFLRPEITYWNMPRYPARRYPDFDPFDQGWVVHTTRNLPVREGDNPLGGVNALTYGFSSNLLRREENAQGQTVVRDLFWFRLTHGVFFNSSSMAMDGTDLSHRRLSDIYAEMAAYPLKGLSLGLNLGAAPYEEGFNRINAKCIFYDERRQNYLDVGYLYLKDFANQINVHAYVDLLPSIKTSFQVSHTFLTNQKLEHNYGVVLQRQCWGVAFNYTYRPDDQRYNFFLIIPGIVEKFKKPPINVPEGREVR